MTSAFAEPPEISMITVRSARGVVVVRPAPRRDPPFDDELGAAPAGRPYDRPLPFERTARLRLQAPPYVLRAALPDPATWGRRLLVGIIEAAGGRRPVSQLGALITPNVSAALRNDFERVAVLGRRHWTSGATVHSVRASEPADDVAELAATVRHGDRIRAVALRLEIRNGRWCCTRLIIG